MVIYQYAVTVALNHEEIGKNRERIINLKINSFINKYKWEGTDFHQKKMIIKKLINKNNVTIALNVLYAKKGKMYPLYVSKHDSTQIRKS